LYIELSTLLKIPSQTKFCSATSVFGWWKVYQSFITISEYSTRHISLTWFFMWRASTPSVILFKTENKIYYKVLIKPNYTYIVINSIEQKSASSVLFLNNSFTFYFQILIPVKKLNYKSIVVPIIENGCNIWKFYQIK